MVICMVTESILDLIQELGIVKCHRCGSSLFSYNIRSYEVSVYDAEIEEFKEPSSNTYMEIEEVVCNLCNEVVYEKESPDEKLSCPKCSKDVGQPLVYVSIKQNPKRPYNFNVNVDKIILHCVGEECDWGTTFECADQEFSLK
jgi:hypothetical protein